ncbi:MAG: histone deacetylase [Sporomusaceae bacterium]|nr:histone deacetylase [Sporomusaceae bacterium]
MNKLGLVFFPAFDWAITPTHPEREERLLYTRDQIEEEGLLDLPNIIEYRPELATLRDLERVHIGVPSVAAHIKEAHLVAAGGAITAAKAVYQGKVDRSFALVRPPGHHAMKVVHGTRGFCTVNMEAIMIAHMRRHFGIKRVAIVDTDVHHGDGTQDIFYHDPDTLFISFHQDGRTLYPGTGFANELGSPRAFGTTINLPLPPGTDDVGLHYVIDQLVLPMLEDFQPELIINSAGQDNHYSDPLANMAITAQGYARLAEKLNAHIAVLEGGYSIEDALPYVNVGIILAMAGLDYSRVIEPDIAAKRGRSDMAYLKKLVADQTAIWRAREELRTAEMNKWGDFFSRRKNIYYDDSGIREQQLEKVRLCRHCRSFMTIATEAETSYYDSQSAFVAVVEEDACPACRQEAREAVYKAKQEERYEHYFIQDKRDDILEEL